MKSPALAEISGESSYTAFPAFIWFQSKLRYGIVSFHRLIRWNPRRTEAITVDESMKTEAPIEDVEADRHDVEMLVRSGL